MNEWFGLLAMTPSKIRYEWMNRVMFTRLAAQIRAMRESRGWSQDYLAGLLGTTQSGVARLETYKGIRRSSIATLTKIASVFDVGLIVRFCRWSEWITVYVTPYGGFVSDGLSPQALAPLPFDQDLAFLSGAPAPTEPA